MKSKIFTILTLSTSCIILFFILKGRLFRQIFIINLLNPNLDYSQYIVILTTYLITILLFIVVNVQVYLYLKKPKESKIAYPSKIIQKLLPVIQFFSNIFVNAYAIIFDYVGEKYTLYLILFTKVVVRFRQYNVLLIYVGEVIPRLLILIVFVLELSYKEIHYYYYSLILLIIPLIFRVLTFIFNDISPRVLPTFMSYITNTAVTENIPNLPDNIQLSQFTMKPEYSRINIDFFMENFYYPLTQIVPVMEEFTAKLQKIRLIITYIYYTIHVIGWSFVFYTVILYPIWVKLLSFIKLILI